LHTRLKPVMQPGGGSLHGNGLDRLADAIVSLEYYMETLQAGRSDPWYMLDNAQSCLQALDELPAPVVPTVAPLEHGRAAAGESAAGSDAAFAETVALMPLAGRGMQPPGAAAAPQSAVMAPTLAPRHAAAALAEHADPELVKLFVEEAREELEKITRQFALWDQNPLEQSALSNVRRSFHTLKGSGRMVGARDLAELAWAIENLLNRLLDNTLTRTPAIVATVREAVAAMPQLIEQLETGAAPAIDFVPIVTRAHSLAAGREPGPAAEGETDESPTTTVASGAAAVSAGTGAPGAIQSASATAASRAPVVQRERTPAPASGAMTQRGDEALRDIYARETAAHVAVVRKYLAREAGRLAPHELPEEVYRACHTLSGSSKMAEARHGVRLAQPLDHWLRKAFDSEVGLADSDLALMADCMSAMEAVAAHLDESTAYFVSHGVLCERIAAAERELDRRIAQSVEAETPTGVHPAPEPPGSSPAEGPAASPAEDSIGSSAPLPASEPPVDFDPEVASIFTEEATELIETAESALGAWRAEPSNAERLAALKRPLHTLKGGARMAGIAAMGDLSHELETLVNQLDSGVAPRHDSTFDALQASIDALSNMRDNVAAGRGVAPARELIARLRSLERPDSGEPEPGTSSAPGEITTPRAEVGSPQVPAMPVAPAAPIAQAAQTTRAPQTRPATPATPAAPIAPAAPEGRPAPASLREPQPEFAVRPLAGAAAGLAARGAGDAAAGAGASAGVGAGAASAVKAAVKAAVIAAAGPAVAALEREPPAIAMESLSSAPEEGWSAPLPVPPGREPVAPTDRPEMARVDAELLDQLLNIAGEVSISRARLEQQLGSIDFNLGELSRTVTRLKEQLRKLEIETEKQILNRHEDESGHRSDFDPLELDRYSTIQQFSRGLAETASDVASIQQLLETMTQDTQNLLQLQARTVTELQNGLMRTRMVPFQRHVQRLARIVRQAGADTGKRAELAVEGASGELDRQVLERMLPPFEHMLRNAVVHGIESPEERAACGKAETGTIRLALQREGAEVMVRISDDGAGMNLQA
ncbi:MAG TPA: Hpt domain-containing protein, partial [Steroidobacteraceae bacterium]